MNIMTKRGSQDNVVTYEHICDTTADMQAIDPHYVTLGSACIVVNGESGGLEAYIANSNKEWENIIIAGGEGTPTLPIEILDGEEYDHETGFPLLANPSENIIYLVPSKNETNNTYQEWIYIDDTWELFGNGENLVTGVKGSAESNYNRGNVTIYKDSIGLGNVDNTSDLNKPVSTAQQAAINQAVNAIASKTVTLSGTDLIVNAEANTRYICGELSTLSFTPVASGICDILFTSGSSKTILTLPNTVKMPDWFEVEANMIYEISIMDGIYGVVTSWAV